MAKTLLVQKIKQPCLKYEETLRINRKASKEARLLNQSIEVDEHDGVSSLPSSTDAYTDDDGGEFTSSAVVKKNDNKKGIGEYKSERFGRQA